MNDEWLRLAHVGMHPDRVRGLMADAGTPDVILHSILRGSLQVPERARAAARVGAEQRRDELGGMEVEFLLNGWPGFPPNLAGLPDAPPFLFQRGARFEGLAIGIVGTRSCTAYGRRLATSYGAAVSHAGWTVVSGLARGIDGAADRGSLQGTASGIAVLGSGIDVWYPAEHSGLGIDILESGGTVWSESPPGTPPVGWRFPPRNRIISGIAEVVVVVEAGVRGGALITARTALEQGKEVCATPGDVGRASSAGCNLLIRDGTIPVHDAEDLVEELQLLVGPSLAGGDSRASSHSAPDGVLVDDYLRSLDDDPIRALAELGRLDAAGTIEIRDGLVWSHVAFGNR